MEILKFMENHWSDIIMGISFLAGVLGLRAKAHKVQATWEQVQKWANAAADGVIIYLQTRYKEDEHIDETMIVNLWRARLLEFATAIGFDVSDENMRKALAIANERLGKVALTHNLSYIAKVAEAIRKKMTNGSLPAITKTERAKSISTPPPSTEKKP